MLSCRKTDSNPEDSIQPANGNTLPTLARISADMVLTICSECDQCLHLLSGLKTIPATKGEQELQLSEIEDHLTGSHNLQWFSGSWFQEVGSDANEAPSPVPRMGQAFDKLMTGVLEPWKGNSSEPLPLPTGHMEQFGQAEFSWEMFDGAAGGSYQ